MFARAPSDGMFEITADDIAALNDEDLRSLVALLCEAELHSRGLSGSAVTWGGDQNAADGGVDVRVAKESTVAPCGVRAVPAAAITPFDACRK